MSRTRFLHLILLVLLSADIQNGFGQGNLDVVADSTRLHAQLRKTALETERSLQKLNDQIQDKSSQLQHRWQRTEQRLAKRLKGVADSSELARLLQQGRTEGAGWVQKLQSPDSLLASLGGGPYISRLDSLSNLLKWLPTDQLKELPVLQQLGAVRQRLAGLQQYEQWLQQRQGQWSQLWQQQQGRLGQLMPKELKQLQTSVLAARSQFENWKTVLNEPGRAEEEALRLLNKLPAWQRFMQQNGELSRLFGGMGGSTAAGTAGQASASIVGLQTVQGMQQLLQQRFGQASANTLNTNAGGAGGSVAAVPAFVQQALQQGMGQVSQLQGQLMGQLGTISNQLQQGGQLGNAAISPYQAEQAALQAKPFGKRLELGWNLQGGQRLTQLPASNDIALSAGYKLNPRSVIGVGLSYKFGLGSWQKIQLTHEGLGLRTFIDWRLKGSWWISGGMEWNYWQRIADLQQWRHLAWQRSGVLGLTRKVKLPKGDMKLQILVDLLQISSGLPQRYLLIRVGRSL